MSLPLLLCCSFLFLFLCLFVSPCLSTYLSVCLSLLPSFPPSFRVAVSLCGCISVTPCLLVSVSLCLPSHCLTLSLRLSVSLCLPFHLIHSLFFSLPTVVLSRPLSTRQRKCGPRQSAARRQPAASAAYAPATWASFSHCDSVSVATRTMA